jgi:hypothetical protein
MFGLLVFFTTWNALIILFHKFLYQSIHLKYLTFITCILGTYLAYYNPKHFEFLLQGKKYRVEGWAKVLVVDTTHFIPFIFIYCLYHQYYETKFDILQLVNAIILLLIYVVLLNIKRVYSVSLKELFTVFLIGSCLFFGLDI